MIHPYKLIDIKYNTKFYKEFIVNKKNKTHKTKKNTTKNKNNIQNGGIIYSSNTNSFDIKYIKGNDYNPSIIFIGDSKTKCFLGLIDDKYQPNEITIQDFNFNIMCNTTKTLKRGNGMLNLMNVIIKYIKDNLKHITTLRLTDKALLNNISVIDNKKHNVILSNLYFLKYEKTYYQYKYNFEFDSPEMLKVIENNINKYKNYILSKEKFVKYLNKFVLIDNLEIIQYIKIFFKNNKILNKKQITKTLNNTYDVLFLELLVDFIFNDCNLLNIYGKEYIYHIIN